MYINLINLRAPDSFHCSYADIRFPDEPHAGVKGKLNWSSQTLGFTSKLPFFFPFKNQTLEMFQSESFIFKSSPRMNHKRPLWQLFLTEHFKVCWSVSLLSFILLNDDLWSWRGSCQERKGKEHSGKWESGWNKGLNGSLMRSKIWYLFFKPILIMFLINAALAWQHRSWWQTDLKSSLWLL